MKVSDYEIDFASGSLFTCCADFIQEFGDKPAKIGMVLKCVHCGQKMKLAKSDDGVLRWRGTE